MAGVLELRSSVGKGQENDPEDVYELDSSLRQIGVYAPPPEYREQPQYFITEPDVNALERFQEQKGIKIDGYARPGGPSEQAINNALLEKPRGAGLLLNPPLPLGNTVGAGQINDRKDVQNIQRTLGALGYLNEDPFDKPHGFIDFDTVAAIRSFQKENGLQEDGWIGPAGETEHRMWEGIGNLRSESAPSWISYWNNQRKFKTNPLSEPGLDGVEDRIIPVKGPPPGQIQRGPDIRPEVQYPPRLARYMRGVRAPVAESESPPISGKSSDGETLGGALPNRPPRFLLGYTDEYDYYQWIDQQQRLNEIDRSEGLSVPGNERAPTEAPRSGFQGIGDGRSFSLRFFAGRADRLASEAIVGHRGSEPVRRQNYSIVEALTKLAGEHDCKVTHEGGSQRAGTMEKVKETILGRRRPDGSTDKHEGSARPDITFLAPTNRKLYINTVDRRRDLSPTLREDRSAIRILENSERGDLLLIVPKLKPNESMDFDKFAKLLSMLLDELCSASIPNTRRYQFDGILRAP